jgi:hypothetical protein
VSSVHLPPCHTFHVMLAIPSFLYTTFIEHGAFVVVLRSVLWVDCLFLTACLPVPLAHSFFNDLWVFDTDDLKWSCMGPRPGQQAPSPRGGCQLALHADAGLLFLFGGFSVRHAEGKGRAWVGMGKCCAWVYMGDPCLNTSGLQPGGRQSSMWPFRCCIYCWQASWVFCCCDASRSHPLPANSHCPCVPACLLLQRPWQTRRSGRAQTMTRTERLSCTTTCGCWT